MSPIDKAIEQLVEDRIEYIILVLRKEPIHKARGSIKSYTNTLLSETDLLKIYEGSRNLSLYGMINRMTKDQKAGTHENAMKKIIVRATRDISNFIYEQYTKRHTLPKP